MGLFVLTAAVLLLGACPLSAASANAPSAANPVAVSLLDDSGARIANVRLAARIAGIDRPQDAYESQENSGRIVMNLPPGRYYFTGDVSVLNASPVYSANFKIHTKTMFYYISEPMDIAGDTREITLKVSSAKYIDVADIAGARNFSLHIHQAELGIDTTVDVHGSPNGVRLFLPVYKHYTFANLAAVLHLKWPVYVTPGLHFVFSAK